MNFLPAPCLVVIRSAFAEHGAGQTRRVSAKRTNVLRLKVGGDCLPG